MAEKDVFAQIEELEGQIAQATSAGHAVPKDLKLRLLYALARCAPPDKKIALHEKIEKIESASQQAQLSVSVEDVPDDVLLAISGLKKKKVVPYRKGKH